MRAGIESALMSETRTRAPITPAARFSALLPAEADGRGRPLRVSSENGR